MDKKHNVSIMVVICAVFTALVIGMVIHITENFVYHDEEHRLVSTTDEKNIAPDFTVFDNENKETHLSEHLGRKTVMSFWATWCGPCKSMLENFNDLYEDNEDGIEFMMINLTDGIDETVEVAKNYVEKKGLTLPVYYDLSYSAAHSYHVNTLPVTVFIDENGYISNIHQGSLSKSQIREYIKAIGVDNNELK